MIEQRDEGAKISDWVENGAQTQPLGRKERATTELRLPVLLQDQVQVISNEYSTDVQV